MRVIVTNGKTLYRAPVWNPTIDRINALRLRLGRDEEEQRPLSPAELYHERNGGGLHRQLTFLGLLCLLKTGEIKSIVDGVASAKDCWNPPNVTRCYGTVGKRLARIEKILGAIPKPDDDVYMFWLGDPSRR